MMNNELYHFNPNHDRLGRFSKSAGGGSPRSIQKKLNKLDKQQVKYIDKMNTANFQGKRLATKAQKLQEKGKDITRYEKAIQKKKLMRKLKLL